MKSSIKINSNLSNQDYLMLQIIVKRVQKQNLCLSLKIRDNLVGLAHNQTQTTLLLMILKRFSIIIKKILLRCQIFKTKYHHHKIIQLMKRHLFMYPGVLRNKEEHQIRINFVKMQNVLIQLKSVNLLKYNMEII